MAPVGITALGERGVGLSGGQRQRIGIDTATEAAVMETIGRFHGEKTIILVAHRLTTLKECDAVHRVEGGC